MPYFRHRFLVLAFAGAVSAPAHAHDFWIQPDRFTMGAGDTARLSLQAGHGPERQASPIPVQRIKRFAELTPAGETVDLRNPGGRTLRAVGDGVHLLVLETDDKAQSTLPAGRFNDYLRAEGLAAALAHRVKNKLMDDDGAERYSRVAKAIVDIGSPGTGNQALATKALGLPLEIVLDRSPYVPLQSAQLPLHVMYEGRALAGALVKLTNLDHDAEPLEVQVTDEQGRAHFAMPRNGSWLLNVIWTKPVQRSDGIDFETIFSSLSFGVRS